MCEVHFVSKSQVHCIAFCFRKAVYIMQAFEIVLPSLKKKKKKSNVNSTGGGSFFTIYVYVYQLITLHSSIITLDKKIY